MFRNRRAFTLIELLVVIAIIAILAAILFPVFAQARARARAIACISNLKQLGTASMMYAQDYDETLPGGWNKGCDTGACGAGNCTHWRDTILPYVQKYKRDNTNNYEQLSSNTVLSCPESPAGASGPTSYGINDAEVNQGVWNGDVCTSGTFGRPLAALNQPASLVMMADAAQTTGSLALDPNFNQGSGSCTNIAAGTGDCGPFAFTPERWRPMQGWNSCDWNFAVPGRAHGDWPEPSGNNARRPVFRHALKCNVVFADGHAKAVSGGGLKARLGTPEDIWHNW
jgi:prepilin-type N-terminal cleavage/methylation domain-containing protein/prepilin-type processing-associated H-X9-DG protein